MKKRLPKPIFEKSREGKIAKRRAEMPEIHRVNYDKAMTGRSLKAAVKGHCLECVGWQKEEVRLCTDLACPLYPYRPYRRPNQCSQGSGLGAESTNSGKGDNYAG